MVAEWVDVITDEVGLRSSAFSNLNWFIWFLLFFFFDFFSLLVYGVLWYVTLQWNPISLEMYFHSYLHLDVFFIITNFVTLIQMQLIFRC